MKQHSIKEPVSATGIGVHSGKSTTITLLPAPENTGIVFIRNKLSIKATVNNVSILSWRQPLAKVKIL